jgi:hypothetical protein
MDDVQYIAFAGTRRIASGGLEPVALETKQVMEGGESASILIFDSSGQLVEVDFRGTADDVRRRVAPAPRGPGRPRMGVVAREVTLLPRHWEWLNSQPGGASVALRKLVEEARRTHAGQDGARQAREAAYRFMSHIAGNLAGFEEATRALFAGDLSRFKEQMASWPPDVRDHALFLADPRESSLFS